MDIGIQNLLLREQNIHVSLYKTYLDKPDRFIFHFKKKGLKALFSASHGAAICRIHKNATYWLTKKIRLINFVRINKLDIFMGFLPT